MTVSTVINESLNPVNCRVSNHEEKDDISGYFFKKYCAVPANQLHGSSVAFVKKISGIMQLLFHNRFEDSAGSIAGIHPGRILWQTFK